MNKIDERLADILNGYAAISALPDFHNKALEVAVQQIKSLFDYKETKSLEERKEDFINSVRVYVESGELDKKDANDFVLYWLEKSIKGRKFRFELEKSWDLDRRLATWMKNKKKFSVTNMLKKG